eukprot:13459176-Ditylum_brightwellii.AAC.1
MVVETRRVSPYSAVSRDAMDKMAKMAILFPPQDFPPSHKYKYAATALGGAIQTHQESTWERYTNTPRKCWGALYKYTKKAIESAIKIRHHHSFVCNPHTIREVPMVLYK